MGYNDDRALGTMLESLPDEVVAGLEVRDAWRQDLAKSTDGLEFIVVDLARWPVGSVVRVAFLDGDNNAAFRYRGGHGTNHGGHKSDT